MIDYLLVLLLIVQDMVLLIALAIPMVPTANKPELSVFVLVLNLALKTLVTVSNLFLNILYLINNNAGSE